MKAINLEELIPRAHQASKANGWWESKPEVEQSLLLVQSELCEAMEADRKGKRANMRGWNAEEEYITRDGDQDTSWGKQRWADSFRSCIKDSVEDELADAYIRLCDLSGGWNQDAAAISQHVSRRRDDMIKTLVPHLAVRLFRLVQIVGAIVDAFDDEETVQRGYTVAIGIGYALGSLEDLAFDLEVDLARHIDLKLRYNATRGIRHGDKAY